MLALLVITGSSYTFGSLLCRCLRLRFAELGEALLYAIGIGLGAWCYGLFALGHAGLFYRPLLVGCAVAAALPTPVLLFYWLRRRAAKQTAAPGLSALSKVLLASVGVVLALTLVSCFAPVTGGISNDEICLHLSIPKEWLSHHGIARLPFYVSYQAGNAHLLFLLASCFEPQSGPRLLSWLSFVLCLGAVYRLARGFLSRDAAIIAVAVAGINPLVFRAASIAFVDLESALFVLLPLCALSSYAKDKRIGWLAVAGFTMAVGCGIKPTNIVYSLAALGAAALSWFAATRSARHTVAAAVIVCAVAAPFASTWPVRNMLFTGSPVFPPPLALYRSGENLKPLLGGKAPYTQQEVKIYYDYCRSRYGDYRRGILSFAKFPWDITMRPERFQIGDSIGTLLLSFLPLVFLFLPLPAAVWFLVGFALSAGALLYFAVLPEARYYIAALMALSPVVAYITTFFEKYKTSRLVVRAVIAANVLFSLAVAIRITAAPIRAALSPATRTAYRQSGVPFFEAFEYLREHGIGDVLVSSPSQVLYYLPGTYSVDTALNRPDPSHDGRAVLDIDYSQTLGRDPAKRRGAYSLARPPEGARLLFDGPDARVYTFAGAPARAQRNGN